MTGSPRRVAPLLLTNAEIVRPEAGVIEAGDILIVDGVIEEVGSGVRTSLEDAVRYDLHGQHVVPGLIDSHVHVTAVRQDLRASAALPPDYVYSAAGTILGGMLRRGFTTVRDVGGADWGLAAAARDGSLGHVPRLLFGGKALSPTGGHGDMRALGDQMNPCCSIGQICDGAEQVRRAARRIVASGGSHVKLMLGGGVTSEHDRLESLAFTDEEITAAVEEAERGELYATGHAYTADAILRGVRLGLRCIEHGNLLDEHAAGEMAANGVFLVPTLVTYEDLADLVESSEAAAHVAEKLDLVREQGLRALEIAHRAGVQVVFGTDLLGVAHSRQLEEFAIRSRVLEPVDVLRSATTTAARLLGMEGRIGDIVPGAAADLLISRLNPLEQSVDRLRATPYVVVAAGMPIPFASPASERLTQ